MTRRPNRPVPLFTLAILAALVAIGFYLAILLDRPVFRALDWPTAEREDWHRVLRIVGYLPTWLLAGGLVAALSRSPSGFSRASPPAAMGLYVFFAPLVAGLLAEPLKLVVRRLRPDPEHLDYAYRAFADNPWSSAGLGLPSSHATVAFAGAAALCLVAPRASLIWLLLAAGCGFTRLADRAHWLSDVYAAAVLGVVVAILLARLARISAPRKGERL